MNKKKRKEGGETPSFIHKSKKKKKLEETNELFIEISHGIAKLINHIYTRYFLITHDMLIIIQNLICLLQFNLPFFFFFLTRLIFTIYFQRFSFILYIFYFYFFIKLLLFNDS